MTFELIIQIVIAIFLIGFGILMWRINLIELIPNANPSDRSNGKAEKITRRAGLFCIVSGVSIAVAAYLTIVVGVSRIVYLPLLTIMGTCVIYFRLSVWGDNSDLE
jgi:hypothetical protein